MWIPGVDDRNTTPAAPQSPPPNMMMPQSAQPPTDVSYTGQNTGYPTAPVFLSNLNPDGSLKSDYTLNAQPGLQFQGYMDEENSRLNGLPTLNTDPLHNLESFASGHGDSPWAQAQLQALQQSQGQAMGAAKANTQSANTAALDAMASRGGLNTGAMENMGRNSANQSMLSGNAVVGQGLAQQGQIRSQDEQNRLGIAANLPGQEVQAMQPALQEQSLWQQAAAQNQAQRQQLDEQQQQYRTGVDQYNMGSKLGGLNAQNQFNLGSYQQQIAQQAGHEQADAEANRGKK
jgi:hypothetical protein